MHIFDKIQHAIQSLAESSAPEDSSIRIETTIGSGGKLTISVRPSAEPLELDGLNTEELNEILDALEHKLETLEMEEPEDSTSEEYEEWEDQMGDLEEQIDEVRSAIDELEDEMEQVWED